ncbi:MAG: O-antigen ligase family protein, partial [Anaerolineaceae bacterium]
RRHQVFQFVKQALWALLILLLPFTSLPLLARRLGSMVGPASIIPLALLTLIWWLPALYRRGGIPHQSIPLFAFLGVALFSIAVSFFLEIPPFQNAQPWRQAAEGAATLLLGMAFYLLVASRPADEDQTAFTLRMLNYAGLILLGWALVQEVTFLQQGRYTPLLRSIQALFSTGGLYRGRVTAFAFEPSWLSHQLNMIFLPFWLASTVQGYTAHHRKILGISLENLLLAGGVITLYLSKSRLGLLAFLLCVALLLFLFSLRIVRRLQARFSSRAARGWTAAGFYLGLAVLGILLLAGTGLYLSKTDPRMADLFDFSTLRSKTFLDYAENLSFAARIAYWQAGWNVFNEHPLLGVGLDNAGFFFYDHLDPSAWEFMEVHTVMYNFAAPPNIKNLWVRLLAETGLAGFAVFATWLLVILATGLALLKRPGKFARVAGLAVVLTLTGLLVEGFSVDTFALPYFWITFGLGTAVYVHGQLPAETSAAAQEPL